MKTFLSCLVAVSIIGTVISPVFAATSLKSTDQSNNESTESTEITYPSGEDFTRLKSLIDLSFSKNGTQSYYSCLANRTLCSNYRYTSVIEKAIKFIVLKTYQGNEDFYGKLFSENSSISYDSIDPAISWYKPLQWILSRIPKGTSITDWKTLWFGNSIGGELLDASFWINFDDNANTSSMLTAIEQKIKDLKQQKCQKENRDSYSACPWSGDISNLYLPTPEEIYKETIYLNWKSVKISEVMDEIDFIIDRDENDVNLLKPTSSEGKITPINASDTIGTGKYIGYMNENVFITTLDISYNDALQNCIKNAYANDTSSIRCLWNGREIYTKSPPQASQNVSSKTTYTLRYKKSTFTLDEAKAEIEKKDSLTSETVLRSGDWWIQLPCISGTSYLVRSECAAASSTMKNVLTALGVYYSDNERYPKSIDDLNKSYMPKQEVLVEFKKNFTYKNISTDTSSDYEIQYIGKIGEDGVWTTDNKKNYIALLSWATVPTIPDIFAHIPHDRMVLYVRNPGNLIDMLEQKSNTSNRLSWIDISESVKKLLQTFFELENFEQIKMNLKNEMAVVVNNIDATAPDIVIILSEADKDALSPTAKARIVSSKDGYIFIANSKESIETFMSLPLEKSLQKSPDFQYVWWKKSAKIKDAFVFVGDAFFEKLLTLETYISHFRKYRDYAELWSLQELVWAYSDAFGSLPTTLDQLEKMGLTSLKNPIADKYTIQDGLVLHKNIGSVKSVKTLSESNYDLSQITRSEIESYKANVLKYREIWRSSLDPMGIVLNRYGDGMEIDFFMTPIPTFWDSDMNTILWEFFQNATKDSLSFLTNPHIRHGLVSFVFGFDAQKIQDKIKQNPEIWKWFEEFSREVLDGKNIFDYFGGEFAWSIWWVDADMLDGWNIEKVDVYGSIQVTSEEKWKEFIEILRSKIVKEFWSSWNDETELIKWFLVKPLIEDYSGKKIYYIEWLPIPFVGKIGFAYTFVDDFFIIGLNRSTIRKVIDAAGNKWKDSRVSETDTFEKNTFFASVFDGVSTSDQLQKLYEKNKTSLPRYVQMLGMDALSGGDTASLVSVFYANKDRNKRLGISLPASTFDFGSLKLESSADSLLIRIDDSKTKNLTGSTLQEWESMKTQESFPKDLLSTGIPLEDFFLFDWVDTLISINMIIHLDSAFSWEESLLRNMLFGFNIGDNEVGFNFYVFRNKDSAGTNTASPTLIYLILWLMGVSVVTGVLFLIYRRKSSQDEQHQNNTTELTTSSNQATPSVISEDSLSDQTAQIQEVTSTVTLPQAEETLPQVQAEETLVIPPDIPQMNPAIQEVNQDAPISWTPTDTWTEK
jgi:hypothetical protein